MARYGVFCTGFVGPLGAVGGERASLGGGSTAPCVKRGIAVFQHQASSIYSAGHAPAGSGRGGCDFTSEYDALSAKQRSGKRFCPIANGLVHPSWWRIVVYVLSQVRIATIQFKERVLPCSD